MSLRSHFQLTLLATAICGFVLPFPGDTIACASNDGLIVTGNREIGSHPELSLTTDFWRSEFHKPEATEQRIPSGPESRRYPGGLSTALQNALPRFSAASLAEEQALQEHSAADAESQITSAFEDSNTTPTFSEWDRAASTAIGPRGESTTREGPSLITAIVAVVGIVIVFGTYCHAARTV